MSWFPLSLNTSIVSVAARVHNDEIDARISRCDHRSNPTVFTDRVDADLIRL